MRKQFIAVIFLISVLITGCADNYTPKPKGYIRLDLPEKLYQQYDTVYPYSFMYPQYAIIEQDSNAGFENTDHRFNIQFPTMKSTIHMTFGTLYDNNLDTLIQDAVDFVYRHVPKATHISKSTVTYADNMVHGTVFKINGKNVASPIQFYVTDSTNNFLRGSLYFNAVPNNDSLKPVIDFIKVDIDNLLATLKWK